MLQLAYVRLEDIDPWEGNPKRHDIEGLKAAMRRYGYTQPVIVNEANGILLSGHGRVAALLEMQGAGESPPESILAVDGSWQVPAIISGVDLSDLEHEAYLLDDNLSVMLDIALVHRLEAFDQELAGRLIAELWEFGQSPIFAPDDELHEALSRILDAETPEPEEFDVEHAVSTARESRIGSGELWQLGMHRLLCGDSGDSELVSLVLGDEKPLLMVTDPPYGVSTDHSWRDKFHKPTSRPGGIEGDTRADWRHVFGLWPAQVAYVWHATEHMCVVRDALEASGYEIRQQIIWKKTTMVLSRSAYHWIHEPCWYAVRRGENANWHGDRSQKTVWEHASPISGRPPGSVSPDDASTEHPTQKPLAVFEQPIRNHTLRGDVVTDPFVGSGTAIIAAERLGRRCLAADIDPRWCEVAIQRWEDYTGEKAVRVG